MDLRPSLLQCRLDSVRVVAVFFFSPPSPSSVIGGHDGLMLPAPHGFYPWQPSIFFEPGFLHDRRCKIQVQRRDHLSAWQGHGGPEVRCTLVWWSLLTGLGGWLGRPPDLGQVGGSST